MNTFTTLAGLSCVLLTSGIANGQSITATEPARVSLTQTAYLPVMSKGSVNTTIATGLGEASAAASPWRVSLLQVGRRRVSGEPYSIRVTNASSSSLNLPVGTDGEAIWNACPKSEIAETNLALRVAGQPMPAANLPSAHSCAAMPSSFVTVLPGASVIFQGALHGVAEIPQDAEISAVMSICSASYSLEGSAPMTTRQCQVPAVSNFTGQPVLPGRPRVK